MKECLLLLPNQTGCFCSLPLDLFHNSNSLPLQTASKVLSNSNNNLQEKIELDGMLRGYHQLYNENPERNQIFVDTDHSAVISLRGTLDSPAALDFCPGILLGSYNK